MNEVPFLDEHPGQPKPEGKWPAGAKRRVALACAGATSVNMGLHAIAPTLPVLQEQWQISEAQIGAYQAAYLLPGVFLSVPLGLVADRYGRRRVFVILGVLFAISGFAQGFVDPFGAILALRLVQGIALAGAMPLTITIIADAASGALQVSGQSIRQVILSASGLFWPLLGVAAVSLHRTGPFYLYFYALGVAIVGWFVLDDIATPSSGRDYRVALRNATTNPAMLALLGSGFLRFFLKFAYVTYFSLVVVTKLGGSIWEGGFVLSITAACSALAATQARRLLTRRAGSGLLIASVATMGGSVVLLAIVPSVELAMVLAAVYGLTDGVFGVVQISYVADNVPHDVRGAVIGVSGMFRNWGKFFGPLAVSAVAAFADVSLGFILIGGLTVLASPLLRFTRGFDAAFAARSEP